MAGVRATYGMKMSQRMQVTTLLILLIMGMACTVLSILNSHSLYHDNILRSILHMIDVQLRILLVLMSKLINLGVFEHARRDLVIEEQVDLAKAAVFGLRETEPAPDVAEEVGSGVEEAGLGSPVPG